MEVRFKKEHPEAVIPKYQSEGSAGFDFHCIDSFFINPRSQIIVDTGLSVEIPKGYEMQIRPRSGIAAKYSITVTNSPGTIDSDYRGIIKIMLFNLSDLGVQFNRGDRVAQGVICAAPQFNLVETSSLSETERGTGGFGSTGR